MAERALRMTYEDSSRVGKTLTLRINKCDDTVAGSVVRLAMQAICDNKEVFALDIGDIKKAEFITPMILTPVDLG